LEERQVNKLSAITKNWALSKERVDALLSCTLVWSSCPALFWEGNTTDKDVFPRCFDDLEWIREVEPSRRKVLLIILSEYVQNEQRQMKNDGKRQRSRSKLPHEADRGNFLSLSLRSIMRRYWPNLHAGEQKKKKTMLSLYSRFGWKWQQVQPQGMILSLPDCAAKRYAHHYSYVLGLC
jgi:hypothetical protein